MIRSVMLNEVKHLLRPFPLMKSALGQILHFAIASFRMTRDEGFRLTLKCHFNHSDFGAPKRSLGRVSDLKFRYSNLL